MTANELFKMINKNCKLHTRRSEGDTIDAYLRTLNKLKKDMVKQKHVALGLMYGAIAMTIAAIYELDEDVNLEERLIGVVEMYKVVERIKSGECESDILM